MTDRNLTEEQWELVTACLRALACSNPDGPTEREAEQYQDLIDLGFTPKWIAENI